MSEIEMPPSAVPQSTDDLIREMHTMLLGLSAVVLAKFGPKQARQPRVPKAKPDPLAELVAAIRTVKEAQGLVFDEAATRAKLADPAFKRKARQVPAVAAELARRKGEPAPAAAADPVAAL